MEIDALATPWVNARVAHLLSVHRMTAIRVGDGISEESSSDNYDQVIFTQNVETIEAFSSCVVTVKVGKAHTGGCTNVTSVARAVTVLLVPEPPMEAQLQEGG